MTWSPWVIYLTPTLALSLLVESERSPSLLRLTTSLSLLSRVLLGRPSLLRAALEQEITDRPLLKGEEVGAISALTLRTVDHCLHSREGNAERGTPIYPEELAVALGSNNGVDGAHPAYHLLQESLERVLTSYAIVDEVVERTQVSFATDGSDDAALRELFLLLKPDAVLSGMVTKQWQDLGFQRVLPLPPSSPSSPNFPTEAPLLLPTFEVWGCLRTLFSPPSLRLANSKPRRLDSLLFFARSYGDRAVQVVDEAVNGGARWYPLALASIHMTSFALSMGTSRDLQLTLLRSLQTRPTPLLSAPDQVDPTPFLRICSDLLLLFHSNWLRNDYTVMQFEQVSKEFQECVRPWMRRGILDGRALGWDMRHDKDA